MRVFRDSGQVELRAVIRVFEMEHERRGRVTPSLLTNNQREYPMRRPIFSLFTIAIFSYCFMIPFAASAQDGGTKLRGALKYSGHVEAIGIGVGADLPVADKIRAGGDFNYYLPGDEFGISVTAWSINANGYYEVMVNDSMTIHALAGINILNFSYGSDFCDQFGNLGISCDDTFTDIGLNIGGLAEFGSGNIGFFGTLQFVGIGGDSDGLVIGGGISKTL